MKKKITLLWRPAWLPLALLWLGGLLQSPQALAQEHRLDAKPAEAQIERNEIINTDTPLQIVAPDPQPASLPAADVKRLLEKARKSDVCDTVRLSISVRWEGEGDFMGLILVGEGEGVIKWGDGTQSACVAVEEADSYEWKTYGHAYPGMGNYELEIYTSSPNVRIVGINLYHYTNYTQYQLVENVDVRACPSLMYLYCNHNQLKTVDVSQNTALETLACQYNQLTFLDLSKNTALTYLYCYNNQLTTLDLSENTALVYLDCYKNRLYSLDLSKNTALTKLYCNSNRLTSLDLSKNTALTVLYCNSNGLTSLDLSQNTALETLACQYNQLTFLDLSKNTALTYLYCYNNQLTTLDLSENTALVYLDCYNNRLTSLDLSKNTALTKLYCNSNGLTSLDLSKNTALDTLYCGSNRLTSLDLSKNTALEYLNCNSNQLTTLDLSKNTALTYLDCYDNRLTTLDLSKNAALTDLSCYNNRLTTLDLSKNAALTDLSCYNNRLTTLDLSKNTTLTSLYCYNNQLTSLDVSKNLKLRYLQCNDNGLTSINVMEKPEDLSTYGYSQFDARNNRLGCAVLTALSKMNGQIYLSPQKQSVELTLGGTLDLSGYMTYEGQQTVCDFSPMPASAYEWVDGRLQIKQAGLWNFSMYNPAVRENDGDAVVVNWNIAVYPSGRDTVRWTWKVGAGLTNTCYLDVYGDSMFVVNWGDGQDTVLAVPSDRNFGWPGVSHVYAETGNYEVTVYGNSSRYMLAGLDFYSNHQNTHANNRFDSLSVRGDNLSFLNCHFNNLYMLDVSQCANLTTLDCSSNYHLKALNISRNVNLMSLECSSNHLDFLDVSQNTALTDLRCDYNQLTSLDLSKNTALTVLYCHNNQLTSLDLSKNTALKRLDCYNNQLTSLDIPKNTALMVLDCRNNRMPFAQVAASSVIMQSKNAELYAFYPQNLSTIEVDLQQGLDLTGHIPTIDGVSADLQIVLNGDTLSERRGYWIQDGVLYPNKIGRYSIRITHKAVKERVSSVFYSPFRIYVATFDMEVTTSNDTLRMTWQTHQANQTQSFSFEGMLGGCFIVHWGDGDTLPVFSKGNEVTLSHQYAEAGVYEVLLCGLSYDPLFFYVETAFGIEMSMVKVQGGTFTMGCTSEQGSDCESNESPSHSVTLDGFYIGQFEVTQAQWKAVMGTTVAEQRDKVDPDYPLYGVGDDYPMYYVSWEEAVAFCEKLSELTGRKYRLPTEAEWEYAARGGQNADGTKYAGSNAIGDVANSNSKTHPVGQKQPNGLGLYDMSGNVYEWCSDWYGSYSSSAATNPQGPTSGSRRVRRGGSWRDVAQLCRVSLRFYISPGSRAYYLGFRVVCEL